MSPVPELEPIREDATLNASEFVAALQAMAAEASKAAEAQAKLFAALKATQELMDSMSAGAAQAAAAEGSLAGAEANVASGAAEAAAAQNAMADATSAAARAASEAAFAESAVAFADSEAARAALMLAVAQKALTESSDGAAAGAGRAAAGFRMWGFGLALTRNALHWVVAGAAEFLAVAIPAAIALAAGLAVAAQGAQNVQQHFAALRQATESTYAAFHQTVGSVLGLGSALQNAQNAANPGVYTVLGSVINDLRGRMGGFAAAGLQVVHMFDEFAARVTVDLQQGMGTQIQGLLSGMVHDLQQFGQVIGNLGHALLNFASAMPGLAHLLLTIAVGISEVVMWASRAGPILTFAMALEEMFRWGGLALGILVRLTGATAAMNAMGTGGFIFRFGAALATLAGVGGRVIQWAGAMIASMTLLGPAAARAGAAIEQLGFDTRIAAATMSPGMVAAMVAATAAVGFLAYKLVTAKTATQQWVASSDQAVAKASDLNVLPAIYQQLAFTTEQATGGQVHLTHALEASKFAAGANAAAVQYASQTTGALAQHVMSLIATANTVRSNISLLAGAFHTSAIGALALANAAGVNLQVGLTRGSEAAKIAVQQINNLKAGLGAMAAPAGVIGADMEAIGVQSQLASSKVGQVNQALDAFIAGTTGGMDAVMQFNATLRRLGSDTVATSQSVTGAITRISASATKMGFDLQGIGPKAQQSWQQFDAALQQGNSVLDTFRVGMAEGVVSWQQYHNEIQAVGGALLPFAAHNATALAMVSQLSQEMGNPATRNLKTLASQFGITGKAAQEMATMGMERAIARMSNLNVVARNLSATVSGQLDTAMAGAIVSASGLDQKYKQWATDVMAGKPAATLAKDLAGIRTAQDQVNTVESKATKLLNDNGTAAKNYATALKGASTSASDLAKPLSQVGTELAKHVITAKEAALSTQGYSTQAHAAAGTSQGLAAQASTANTAVKALGVSASTTRGSLGTVNNEIRNTATAAGAARGPLGTMSNEISNVGSAAGAAAGQVHALASAIAGLQSKTVTVTTNVVTVTSTVHRAMGGPVFPGVPTVVGEAGREMYIPAVPGYILSHAQTEQVMSGASGGQQGTGGPDVIRLAADIHVHAEVDGREVFTSIKPEVFQWMRRNRGVVDGTWVPS